MTLTTPTGAPPVAAVPRDRWGRPMIIPVGGGKPVAYTRASSLGKALTDSSTLTRWKQRQTALGLAKRADLLTAVAAAHDDKSALDTLCEDAMQAVGSNAAATMGTALHSLTELVDTGGTLPEHTPPAARARIGNYLATMRGARLVTEEAELFVVCDELNVAGTFDRLYRTPAGPTLIGDLKTGGLVDDKGRMYQSNSLEYAVQLAIYAHGQRYDPATGERTPLHPDLDDTRGIVVHLPATGERCTLFELDLATGWALARLAREVLDARRTVRLATARYTKETE